MSKMITDRLFSNFRIWTCSRISKFRLVQSCGATVSISHRSLSRACLSFLLQSFFLTEMITVSTVSPGASLSSRSSLSGHLFCALSSTVKNLTLSFAIFTRPPNGVSGSGCCQACITRAVRAVLSNQGCMARWTQNPETESTSRNLKWIFLRLLPKS